MKFFNVSFVALCLLQLSFSVHALSLGDVHHQVRTAVAEIDVLKAHYSPDATSRVPGFQVGKTTVHAYTKAIELLNKIQKFQREKQLPALSVPALPKKRVRSKHILALVELALSELRKINSQLNLKAQQVKEDTSSKTASDLYEKIWQASYLMDALVEPTTARDVLHSTLMIESGLIDIAKRMNKPIEFATVQSVSGKKAVDVTISLYKLLYKVAKLERKLKLKPLFVPAFPAGDVLAGDAFDTAGSVIADLTRIALKLKISPIAKVEQPASNISINDVYAQVVRLNKAVEFLL